MSEQFITTQERYGRQESFIDFGKLVPAFCQAIGGTSPKVDDNGWRGHGSFKLGDLTIYLCHADNDSMGRVKVYSGCPELARKVRDAGYLGINFPSITVDHKRPVAAIAKDIHKRVVNESLEPLTKLRKKLQEQEGQRSSLASQIKTLSARFPQIKFTVKDERSETAEVYLNEAIGSDSVYISGTLYANGSMSFSHFGSLEGNRLLGVLAAVTKQEE